MVKISYSVVLPKYVKSRLIDRMLTGKRSLQDLYVCSIPCTVMQECSQMKTAHRSMYCADLHQSQSLGICQSSCIVQKHSL